LRTLAIVPIKSFASAKQRLAGVLASGSRRSLVQAMFSDVLGGLRRTDGIEAIAVVTDDLEAESLARGDRMLVLHDDRRAGQSEATEIGIDYAEQQGFERVLLVPGDTPLFEPPEVAELLRRSERDEIDLVIVPDRHGTGTNALLMTPPRAIRPAFGPGSFDRHLERARDADRVHRVETIESLTHDVDTPEDLAAVWTLIDGQRRGAQRTRGALAQLERSGARAAIEGARPRSGLAIQA
jgi:2-phospho-L-lactate guanylyltransferase